MSTKPDYEAAKRAFGESYYGAANNIELVIRRTVDAALGDDLVAFAVDALIAEGVLTEERTGKMFPSETRKAILEYRDTERRFVTAWEPIPAEEETR